MVLSKQALVHSPYALDPVNNMQFEYKNHRDVNDRRLVGELSWGDWWKDTEIGERARLAHLRQKPEDPEVYIAPINFFGDKAHLDTHGRQSAHALLITFGNFRNNILRLKGSREPLGIIPLLGVTAAEGKLLKSEELAAARRTIYQASIGEISRCVQEAYVEGVVMKVGGKLRRMVPVVAIVTGDIAELWPALHIKAAWNTKRPCFICRCPLDEMRDENFDVNAEGSPRNARKLYDHLRAIQAANVARAAEGYQHRLPRGVLEREKAAKAYLEDNSYSSAPISSGFEHMPFGNGSPNGVFDAVGYEALHQLDLGLLLAAKDFTCQLSEEYGQAIKADAKIITSPLYGKKSKTLGQLDAIIKQYRPARNSERHAFPTDAFPHGITSSCS